MNWLALGWIYVGGILATVPWVVMDGVMDADTQPLHRMLCIVGWPITLCVTLYDVARSIK